MHSSPDQLALLALGEEVADADEQAHIADCPHCQAQLAEFSAAVQAGRRTEPDDALLSPDPAVWRRIMAELGFAGARAGAEAGADGERVDGHDGVAQDGRGALAGMVRPLPDAGPAAHAAPASAPAPSVGPEGAPMAAGAGSSAAPGPASIDRGRRRRLQVAAVALAAVLALVAGFGLGANVGRLVPPDPAVQLNALPEFPGSSGRASVEEDGPGQRWLVVQMSSPEAATGPREVWLTNTRAQPMVSLGFLTSSDGRFAIPADLDLREFRLVDISQEPQDDTDPRHSGHSMLRGRLPT